MTSDGQLTTQEPTSSPVPTVKVADVAVDRGRNLVREMGSAARLQATGARDRIDQLLKALQDKEDALLAGIAEFAGQIEQTAEMVQTIMGPIEELAVQIEETVTPRLVGRG